MTFKDRTSEFNGFSETIRAQSAGARPPVSSKAHNKSQFMLGASQIGKDIFEASMKLNKLTKLAKKRSLFDDPSDEIEELTFIIKQDIQNLNRQIGALRTLSKSGSAGKQAEAHNDTVIGYLNTRLASTTRDFKDILQTRTETLRTQAERKQRFTGAGAIMNAPDATGGGYNTNGKAPSSDSVLYKHSELPESPMRAGGDVAISMPSAAPMMMMQQTADYTTSRVTTAESIEKTIAELQGIFQQLANLVVDQGQMIERIDSNVETSLQNVERGHNALLTHLLSVMSNRGLIIKIFLVLIVIIVIFVVFFV